MGKLVEVVEVVEMVELVKIDCAKSMKLETSPKVTKSKRNLHWCRSVSNKNTCAFFITVSVKMLLHYLAGSLLQYRAFYYIIGQLLHYRAFFITLSGSNYSIGSYYIIGWYTSVVIMWWRSAPKCTRLKDRDYDVTPRIILILSLTCTPICTRGRRRFARCSVCGYCRRRVRGVLVGEEWEVVRG